jgi:hypothetical protein
MAREYNFIYSRLVNDKSDMIGHIAYSLYKQEKVSWIEGHKQGNDGKEPTEEEFKSFHEACCSEQRINNYRAMATSILQEFMGGSTDMMAEQVAREVSDKVTQHINDNIANRIPKTESLGSRYFHGIMQSILAAVILAVVIWLLIVVVSRFSIGDIEIEFKKKKPAQTEQVQKQVQKQIPEFRPAPKQDERK